MISNNTNDNIQIYNQVSNVEVPISFVERLISYKFTKSVCKVTFTILQLLANKMPYLDITQRHLSRLSGVNESKIIKILERMEEMKLSKLTYTQRGIRVELLGAQKHYLDQTPIHESENFKKKYKNQYIKLPMIVFTEEFYNKSELVQRICLFMIIEGYLMNRHKRTKKISLNTLSEKFICSDGMKEYSNRSRLQESFKNAESFLKMEAEENIRYEYNQYGNRNKKIIYNINLGSFSAGSCDASRIDVEMVDLKGDKIYTYIKFKLDKFCDYTVIEDDKKSWIGLYMQTGDTAFTDTLELIGVRYDVINMGAYFREVATSHGYIIKKHKGETA